LARACIRGGVRFGGEGTGGQSFFNYDWKIGQTYKFMVQATVESDKTSFAAWFFLNETKVWKHLATFRTITGGAPLSGFYSFIEDFRRDGKSLRERRAARFGNGWARGADGVWTALTEARFTADATPVDNIDAGVRNDDFYLATGGDTAKHTELQSTIRRPLGNHRPPEIGLNPPLALAGLPGTANLRARPVSMKSVYQPECSNECYRRQFACAAARGVGDRSRSNPSLGRENAQTVDLVWRAAGIPICADILPKPRTVAGPARGPGSRPISTKSRLRRLHDVFGPRGMASDTARTQIEIA